MLDTNGSDTDTMQPDPATTPNDPWLDVLVRRVRRLGWLLGTLVVVVVGVSLYDGITAVRASGPAPSIATPAMLAVAPGGVIEPSDVPDTFVVLYEGAEAHASGADQATPAGSLPSSDSP